MQAMWSLKVRSGESWRGEGHSILEPQLGIRNSGTSHRGTDHRGMGRVSMAQKQGARIVSQREHMILSCMLHAQVQINSRDRLDGERIAKAFFPWQLLPS